MNLVADACVAAPLVTRLRLRGHEVTAVRDIEAAMADEDVLARAYRLGAILLTEDKDFGDLVVRRRLQTHGIVLLRLIDAGQVRIRPIGE